MKEKWDLGKMDDKPATWLDNVICHNDVDVYGNLVIFGNLTVHGRLITVDTEVMKEDLDTAISRCKEHNISILPINVIEYKSDDDYYWKDRYDALKDKMKGMIEFEETN